jgi:septum formation protein
MLEKLRVPFVVVKADANEDVLPGESPAAYLARVVLAKLHAVRAAIPESLRDARVLVADTTVIADGIMGKPADHDETERMIERLAGRTHEVHTRFAIASAKDDGAPPLHAETVVTRVTFRALYEGEARAYAESGEGLDKAGGYGVQGRAAVFVERVEGSYTNIVGLPACEVIVALRRLGAVQAGL